MALQWLLYPLAVIAYDLVESVFQEFAFFLFIVSMGIVAAYLQMNFPETKGKSTMEIIKLLGYRNNDKKV